VITGGATKLNYMGAHFAAYVTEAVLFVIVTLRSVLFHNTTRVRQFGVFKFKQTH
jgi:hypothetical protein